MSDSEQEDNLEDIEGFATLVMVVALCISLSACTIVIAHAIWPHLLAMFEATQFAP